MRCGDAIVGVRFRYCNIVGGSATATMPRPIGVALFGGGSVGGGGGCDGRVSKSCSRLPQRVAV
jgi:hypothetical protein